MESHSFRVVLLAPTSLDIDERFISCLTPSSCKNYKVTRSNKEFESPFNLALLFLQGMAPMSTLGSNQLTGILFDMNKLFEEYIYQFLLRNKDLFEIDKVHFQVGKRLVNGVKPLGDEGEFSGKSMFNTYSDIICTKHGNRIVIDTKYKIIDNTKDCANGDLFQILAYKEMHNCVDAVLLYPQHKHKVSNLLSVGENTELGVLTINLSDIGSTSALIEQMSILFE